jgi:putative hydrolase of the HAD superfamily
MQIDMIGFDADDTLWENEILYQEAQAGLKEILCPWGTAEAIDEALFKMEMRNLPLYGYGIKAFALSMIETAIQISGGAVTGDQILEILAKVRAMLEADVRLRPYVRETLSALSEDYPLMLITKGDLLDQTAKVERSGLERFFRIVEIVNEKTPQTYAQILKRYDLSPETFLMVGNSIKSDVLPILELGGTAVHIPAETTWAHEIVPGVDGEAHGYHELEHLGELSELIRTLNSKGEL